VPTKPSLLPNTSRWGLRRHSTWSGSRGSRASRGRCEPSWREGRWARIAGEPCVSARGTHAIFFPTTAHAQHRRHYSYEPSKSRPAPRRSMHAGRRRQRSIERKRTLRRARRRRPAATGLVSTASPPCPGPLPSPDARYSAARAATPWPMAPCRPACAMSARTDRSTRAAAGQDGRWRHPTGRP
jgi:hypothetical protein